MLPRESRPCLFAGPAPSSLSQADSCSSTRYLWPASVTSTGSEWCTNRMSLPWGIISITAWNLRIFNSQISPLKLLHLKARFLLVSARISM